MRSPARRLVIFALSLTPLLGCGGGEPAEPQPAPAVGSASATPPTPVPEPTPVPVPVPAVVPAPVPAAPQATAFGPALSAVDLAKAMLMLPLAADRVGISAVVGDTTTYRIVLAPETDPARVMSLAHALGDVVTEAVAWPSATPMVGVEVLEIHGEGLLQLGPASTSTVIAKLPDGAFFVAILGAVTGGTSARDGEAAWAYGVTSSGLAGWVEAKHLVVESGCVLGHAALARALGLRAHDPVLDTLMVGNLQLHREDRRRNGSFVIGESFVATLIAHANCQRADLDVRLELEERPEEFHHALDREHGETFFAVALPAVDGNDNSRWSVYAPRATEPDDSFTLRTSWLVPSRGRDRIQFGVTRGPGGARGHWAYSIQHGREPVTFFASDGTTFAEVTDAVPE